MSDSHLGATLLSLDRPDDATRSHRTYEQLRAEYDEFIAIISHDFRAPVRGITALVEWIVADLPPEQLSEPVKESLALLSQRARHLRQMIDAVSDYGRTSRLLEQTLTMTLAEIAEQAINQAQVPASFRLEIHATPLLVSGPLAALIRCLKEAIDNAWRHRESDHGAILIGLHFEPAGLRCEVQDDGLGLDLARIQAMQPLFRTGDGLAAKGRSGLGLAVISRLATLAGATWQLQPRRDGLSGMTLTMSWPTIAAQATEVAI